MFVQIALAQPLRKIPYKAMLEAADNAFNTGDFYNAAEWYEKAYKEQKDKDLAVKVAECNLNMRDYKRAASWYKRILSRDRTGDFAQYKFEYGKVLKSMGKYKEAYDLLKEFVTESEDIDKKKKAVLVMNGIAKSSEFEENNDALVKMLGRKINSPSSEAGAQFLGDVLYYTSLNRKDEIVYNDKLEGETTFKIYTSSIGKKGSYDKGTALSDVINREGYHTGNPSFSPDGNTMYFTRTLVEEGEVLESKIYYSTKKGDDWSGAEVLGGRIHGDDHFLRYPAIGELYGKKVMFFAADIEGGFGGLDIYYSEADGDASFGTPVNLGKGVNTSEDDVTPFYRDGVLYYSTSGRPGLGGKDIFKTTWDGSNWSPAVNMGLGYNSSYDDTYFALNEDGKKGLLVSNRLVDKKKSVKSKTCCDDIFMVSYKEVVINLLAKIMDGEEALNEAEVTLYDLSIGEDTGGPSRKINLNANDFNFPLLQDKAYKVVVNRKGYFADSLEFNTMGILDDYTVERTISMKKIPEPPKEEYVTVTTNQPIRMNNIYYDFNSDKILPAAEGDLTIIKELLDKYPTMVIELSSHTDSKGTSSYNQKLSQRRANNAKAWLLDRGVSAERINAVGYGESQILNGCVNGKRCSDEEHQFNRRTEFKIISGPTTIEIKKQKKVIRPSGGLPMSKSQADVLKALLQKPVVKFTKNELQLGQVKMGEKVEFSFEYTNVGKADLEIELVTTCHCTTFEYDKKNLKPGETAVLKAVFDSAAKKKLGALREVIDIICNTDNLVEEAVFHVEVVE